MKPILRASCANSTTCSCRPFPPLHSIERLVLYTKPEFEKCTKICTGDKFTAARYEGSTVILVKTNSLQPNEVCWKVNQEFAPQRSSFGAGAHPRFTLQQIQKSRVMWRDSTLITGYNVNVPDYQWLLLQRLRSLFYRLCDQRWINRIVCMRQLSVSVSVYVFVSLSVSVSVSMSVCVYIYVCVCVCVCVCVWQRLRLPL